MPVISTDVLILRLDEARLAYHSLLLKGGVVRIRDSNGEEIQFQLSSASRLAMYILSLEAQLGDSEPGPLQVWVI